MTSCSSSAFVPCPVCSKQVASALINDHLNSCLLAPQQPAAQDQGQRPRPAGGHDVQTTNASRDGHRKRKIASTGAHPSSASELSAKVRRNNVSSAPLAERMRPRSLDEFIGQDDTLATFAPLLAEGSLPSLILWGPPGCGKTSFATVVEQRAAGRRSNVGR